ncbi:translation termination factor eRF1 [Coemansia nantahalensis]|nr:translation termination factor eRF1 [Coemansia nantahalensis]
MRPGKQIAQVIQQLTEEIGKAGNIKSRVTRHETLTALMSLQQRLRQYTHLPPNGLLLYCGYAATGDGRQRLVNVSFSPPKPVADSIYYCASKFVLEPLAKMLEDDRRVGFIIMDGKGCLYGAVTGNSRTVLHSFSVSLPKKHRRGGQSSVRFAHLREEKRHNYVRKVAEKATQLFISNNMSNVAGLVLAGSADFKDVLLKSDLFDKRLAEKVLQTVDVAYGGENGFDQAITLSRPFIADMKLVQERDLISGYFDNIARDTGKVVYGYGDTVELLREGAVETLIVWENLDIDRCVFRSAEGAAVERYVAARAAPPDCDGLELESRGRLIEWLLEEHRKHGASLRLVSDSTPEGTQFAQGLGGLGGMLRWKPTRYDAESDYDGHCSDDSFDL